MSITISKYVPASHQYHLVNIATGGHKIMGTQAPVDTFVKFRKKNDRVKIEWVLLTLHVVLTEKPKEYYNILVYCLIDSQILAGIALVDPKSKNRPLSEKFRLSITWSMFEIDRNVRDR
jgi:hypothetical protein